MDKNTITGLVLIFVILFTFQWLNKPSEEEIRQEKARQEAIAENNRRQEDIRQNNASAARDTRDFSTVVSDSLFMQDSIEKVEELYYLENNRIKVGISNRGGRVAYVELKEYVTSDSMPLLLWTPKNSRMGLFFENMREEIHTNDLYFTPVCEGKHQYAESSAKEIDMVLGTDGNSSLSFHYSLVPDSYELKFTVRTREMGKAIPGKLFMEMGVDMPQLEKSAEFESRYSGVYYKINGEDVENLGMNGEEEEELNGRTKWIAVKQQFFSSVLIGEKDMEAGTITVEKDNRDKMLKKTRTTVPIVYNGEKETENNYSFLFIPNNYYTLLEYGKEIDLHDLVNLGWNWLAWINRYIVIPIFSFLEKNVTQNYGIIILLLTLIIKLVLSPLTVKSYRSSAKMRLLKPQIDAINAKIPAEKAMERQQAMMDLYKKAGVNPMGGCLPMLLSFPILIALFWFFPGAIELRQQRFLWADDLASYDSIATLPFSIPFYGNHVSLFCLLMASVNIIYTWMNSKTQPQNDQMKMMKVMMYMMPIMFLFIFNNYSSGLSYYYFISTLITILITWGTKTFLIKDEKLLAEMAASQKNPSKKLSFQDRLIKMQKEQEKKLREQRERNSKRR